MTAAAPFFFAGGTVPPGSPSYVEREADGEIFSALLAREYCYVLDSRQMGKSSLAVRAMGRLVEAGMRCSFVDLTKIGAAGVTEEQWYTGILAEIARTLGLRKELAAHLKQAAPLSPNQRLLAFLQDQVAEAGEPVVILIDEIDAVRSLDFSTDAFFAGIRQCWNGRSTEPHLANLTFCLMGTALPSDLIRNGNMTPFNIGRRIELQNFSAEETRGFEAGIPKLARPQAATLVRRVLYWTGGQPFLTQRLCRELVETGVASIRGVDELVRTHYLSERARETDSHLADIGKRLLGHGDPSVSENARADVLALYGKLLRGGIEDDEANPSAARIKMSGIARLDGGRLTIRNPIYREVFGPSWVRHNMPSQELHRQRRAFARGVLRTGFVAFIAFGVVGGLAWNNFALARRAEGIAEQASYDAYLGAMQSLPLRIADEKPSEIDAILRRLENNPNRGWEWKYWRHSVPPPLARYDVGSLVRHELPDNEGRNMFVAGTDEGRLYEIRTGKLIRRFPIPRPDVGRWTGLWCADGRRIVMQDFDQEVILLDAIDGKVLRRKRMPGNVLLSNRKNTGYLPGGEIPLRMLDPRSGEWLPYRLNPNDLTVRPLPIPNLAKTPYVTADGAMLVCGESAAPKEYSIVLRDAQNPRKVLRRLKRKTESSSVAVSPNGRTLYVIEDSYRLHRVDLATGRERVLGVLSVKCDYSELSRDGRYLIVGDSNRRACLIRLSDGSESLEKVIPETARAFFVGRGEGVASSYADMRVYETETFQNPKNLSFPNASIARSFILRDGRAVATYWADLEIPLEHVLDLTQHAPRRNYSQGPNGSVVDQRLRFRRSGDGKTWKLYDYATNRLIDAGTEDPHHINIWSSPDGRYIAYYSGRHHVAVYDVKLKRRIKRLGEVESAVAIRFSDDGRRLAVGDEYGNVFVWRTSDWNLVQKQSLCPGTVTCFDFSPDGTRLVAGSVGDVATVMEIATGRTLSVLRGSAGIVMAVAWSFDGKRIAAGGMDRRVRLWDAETGREVGALGDHPATVMALGYLPGGRTLASIGEDGSVRRWMTEDRL
ncbi:MAG: AAA-like domain-containing protein [Fimbriimonas sp.]